MVGLACWLFAGTIAIAVGTKLAWLADSDQSLAQPVQHLGVSYGVLGQLALVWQQLGSSNITTPLILAVVVVLLIMRRWGWAAFLLVCSVGGLLIAETIKHAIGRARPQWSDALFSEVGNSFPSGHTMVGIYGYAVLGLIAMYVIARPAGTVVGWILVAIGVAMGPSRLVLGVHWPSDVVAGWMLSLGWVLIVIAASLVVAYRRHDPNRKADESPIETTT